MPEPTPQPMPDKGGSYVIDPATGERTLVERTADPAPQLHTDPAAAGTQPPSSQED